MLAVLRDVYPTVHGLLIAADDVRGIIAVSGDRLQLGLEGALRGCEQWILEPASWIDGLAPFLAAVDFGGLISETDSRLPLFFRQRSSVAAIATFGSQQARKRATPSLCRPIYRCAISLAAAHWTCSQPLRQ